MSNKKSSLEAAQKFNVYAGGGVFLSALSHVGTDARKKGRAIGESHALYTPIMPLALPRDEAIRACHMARAQGVNSWLVAAA